MIVKNATITPKGHRLGKMSIKSAPFNIIPLAIFKKYVKGMHFAIACAQIGIA